MSASDQETPRLPASAAVIELAAMLAEEQAAHKNTTQQMQQWQTQAHTHLGTVEKLTHDIQLTSAAAARTKAEYATSFETKVQTIAAFEREISRLKAEMKSAIESLTRKLNETEAKLSATTQKKLKLEDEVRDRLQNTGELALSVEILDQKNGALTQKSAALEEEKTRLEQECAELSTQLLDEKTNTFTLTTQYQALEAQRQVELARLKDIFETSKKKYLTLRSEAQAAIESRDSQIVAIQKEVADSQGQLQEVYVKLDAAATESVHFREQTRLTTEALARTQTESARTIADLRAQLDASQERVAQAERQVSTMRVEVIRLKGESKLMSDAHARKVAAAADEASLNARHLAQAKAETWRLMNENRAKGDELARFSEQNRLKNDEIVQIEAEKERLERQNRAQSEELASKGNELALMRNELVATNEALAREQSEFGRKEAGFREELNTLRIIASQLHQSMAAINMELLSKPTVIRLTEEKKRAGLFVDLMEGPDSFFERDARVGKIRVQS